MTERATIISQLQNEINLLQGFKPGKSHDVDMGLGPIKYAFPDASFPLGAVHEFISTGAEDLAATNGFLAGLLKPMMKNGGTALWISVSRSLFPPALASFGIQPDRFIFIDLKKEKHVTWAMEEALKCGALTAVIGEVQECNFTTSRRLQLAVEQSQVTGFILRNNPRNLNVTACTARWKITTLLSETSDDLPGIGFPHWKVELLRIRNGKPGSWEVKWEKGRFQPIYKIPSILEEQRKQTG